MLLVFNKDGSYIFYTNPYLPTEAFIIVNYMLGGKKLKKYFLCQRVKKEKNQDIKKVV